MRKKNQWVDKYEWHDWFAWYPIWVKTGECKETRIWLERVQRKYALSYAGSYTQIRNLDGSDVT
jgi:hypothetical protein